MTKPSSASDSTPSTAPSVSSGSEVIPRGFKHKMPRKVLPPWDRTIQCAFKKYVRTADFDNIHEAPSVGETFKRTVQNFYLEMKHCSGANERRPLLCLPPGLRARIWTEILGYKVVDADDNPTTVSLNQWYFNKDVYPSGHFQSFADASVSLRRYTGVCFAFYAELMVAFCTSRRFHVTVSPYLGPKFSPLAVDFLHRHSTFMSDLTVEFDFTKLGYGPDPRAAALGPGVVNMGAWVAGLVRAQRKRQSFTTLAELTLLCRRFYGNRPAPAGYDGAPAPAPYAGEEHQDVIKPLWALRGLVDTVRLAGFSDPFTLTTIVCLFFPMPEDPRRRDAQWERTFPCDAWPLLPGQRAWLDYGPDGGVREVCGEAVEDSDSSGLSTASSGRSDAKVQPVRVGWLLPDVDESLWEDRSTCQG